MLLDQLEKGEDFTTAERALAKYILANVRRVLELNSRQLAEKAFVSAPTVTRFCKKLGFPSYTAFKVQLSKETTEEYEKMRKVDVNMPFLKTDTPKELAEKTASIALSNIIYMRDHLDHNAIRRISQMLARKKFIDIYGMGLSLDSTREFCEKMAHIGYNVSPLSSAALRSHRAINSGPDQAAMIFSYSGRHKSLIRFAQYLKKNRTQVIVITGNPETELLRYATCSLIVRSDESLMMLDKIDSFGTLYMIHYILDCIFANIFVMHYDENMERIQRNSAVQFDW